MELISLKEARQRGLKRYFTGKQCPRGHISERFVSDRGCCACKAENNHLPQNKACRDRYAVEHPEQMAQYCRDWELRNKDKRAERRATSEHQEYMQKYGKEWVKNNPDKVRAKNKRWYDRHPEKAKAKSRRIAKANPARIAYYAATRRARKKKATPSWADLDAIKAVYEETNRIQKQTGTNYHTDHIIPIRGVHPITGEHIVCGLHTEYNLQSLTEKDNLEKGHLFDPEQYVHELP